MAKMIYKYRATQQTEMLVGAKIIHVGLQHGEMFVWAEVDDYEYKEEIRYFRIYGTGIEIDVPADERQYIGTVFQGSFVWHVYEV